MNIVNFKPNKDNLKSTLPIGIFFISIGLIDIILNSVLNFNLTSFLPEKISFIAPLIFGAIGLYLIRIEFSGNKLLDKINKNFNSSSFNAILTLLVIFALIKYVPPLLNWFIFDADFIGNKKKTVQVAVLAGCLLKFGSTDLYMVCIRMLNSGE